MSVTLSHHIEEIAEILPAQGPIRVFIHHNTLHAFESMPFEQAVLDARRTLGCEPFLSEDRYRRELERGRITPADLEAVLLEELGDDADVPIAGLDRRIALWRSMAMHGVSHETGDGLAWILTESRTLEHVEGGARIDDRPLWEACLAAIARAGDPAPCDASPPDRHRDALVACGGPDLDLEVHPLLIRFLASYLDQGLAAWRMPGRKQGMYACFVELYGSAITRWCAPWGDALLEAVADDRRADRDAMASLEHSLRALGVTAAQQPAWLRSTALVLRGWAGMVRQIETRPDRVPAFAVPAKLVDFFAIRALLDRAVLTPLAATLFERPVPLAASFAALQERMPENAPPTAAERAWPLFQLMRIFGRKPEFVAACTAEDVVALEREIARFDVLTRRRVLHLAYERRLRRRFYDALLQHRAAPRERPPAFQAVFCLDEREESMRRHLEEVDPDVETFGTAGFFGVPMYYRGATDAHPRPLCPVVVRPEHFVAETEAVASDRSARWRQWWRRSAGLVGKNVHVSSRTLVRGTLLMALAGTFAMIPLVLRVVFPKLSRRLQGVALPLVGEANTRLVLHRRPDPPPIGRHLGFTHDEMATIVRTQLENLGIVGHFAPLVCVFGHGSASLNNPHESAYDCGACGGGHGGPNARAFAEMANDPEVRRRLAAQGIAIPDETWFVGGERNTSTNRITLFDLDRLPEHARPHVERVRAALDRAREREAAERCRHFEPAARSRTPRAALAHVEGRGLDLAQPRPEYGHGSNALCLVGRRDTTRGLFLDRRCFLVSYDPAGDPEAVILARVLAAVVPVVVGINLEYYFGTVDPIGYGAGSKLPHNVTSLLGVMDGAQSDLRTGLTAQMVEIHEPVRLTLVVEASARALDHVLRTHDALRQLLDRRWLFLARLDPTTRTLEERASDGFRPHAVGEPLRAVAEDSLAYCAGRTGALPFVQLQPPAAERHART